MRRRAGLQRGQVLWRKVPGRRRGGRGEAAMGQATRAWQQVTASTATTTGHRPGVCGPRAPTAPEGAVVERADKVLELGGDAKVFELLVAGRLRRLRAAEGALSARPSPQPWSPAQQPCAAAGLRGAHRRLGGARPHALVQPQVLELLARLLRRALRKLLRAARGARAGRGRRAALAPGPRRVQPPLRSHPTALHCFAGPLTRPFCDTSRPISFAFSAAFVTELQKSMAGRSAGAVGLLVRAAGETRRQIDQRRGRQACWLPSRRGRGGRC